MGSGMSGTPASSSPVRRAEGTDAGGLEPADLLLGAAEEPGEHVAVVLAPPRRRSGDAGVGAREPPRRLRDGERAAGPVVDLDDGAALHHVVLGGDLGHRAHHAGGEADLVEQRHQRLAVGDGGREVAEVLAQLRRQLPPAVPRGERRVVERVVAAEQAEEAGVAVAARVAGDAHPLAGRDLHDGRPAAAQHGRVAGLRLAGQLPLGVLVDEQQGVDHGHVDVLAPPGRVPREQGGEHAGEPEQARVDVAVAVGVVGEHGPAGDQLLVLELAVGDAGDGVADHRVRPPPRPRAGLAEPGERAVDHAGVALGHLLVADAPALAHARPEVLEHDVGPAREVEEEGAAVGVVEVDGDVLLPGVLLRVVARDRPVAGDREAAEVAGRGLDLDHPGTQVGQRPPADRSGEHPGEVEHDHAVEQPGCAGLPAHRADPRFSPWQQL
jgi:hypothetical protein